MATSHHNQARRAERKAHLLRAEAKAEKARAKMLTLVDPVRRAMAERDYHLAMKEVKEHRRALKRRKRKKKSIWDI